MVIAVLAPGEIKNELLSKNMAPGWEYIWVDSLTSLLMVEADLYIDAKFEMDVERTARLSALLPKTVLIGAVNDTLKSIGQERFIRINNWPGMLSRSTIELSCSDEELPALTLVMQSIGWAFHRVADIPGMVTPRIIAMIINEAYFALDEGISTKEDIDTAMKSGTNYPFGPFKWAEKIGLQKILELLTSLNVNNSRYEIAGSLRNAIIKQNT